jgi:hypothetical protein
VLYNLIPADRLAFSALKFGSRQTCSRSTRPILTSIADRRQPRFSVRLKSRRRSSFPDNWRRLRLVARWALVSSQPITRTRSIRGISISLSKRFFHWRTKRSVKPAHKVASSRCCERNRPVRDCSSLPELTTTKGFYYDDGHCWLPVCTENLIRVAMESPKLAE